MRLRSAFVLMSSIVLITACADAPLTPRDGDRIEHDRGAGDLLVRVAFEGGLVDLAWSLTAVPTFSLYGDGTLVQPGVQIELYPGPALPAISSRRIDEAGIQAILREALDAIEGVPDHLTDLYSMQIADVPSTVITVNAGGVERRVSVNALSEVPEQPEGMPDDVYQARQRLSRLVEKLGNLEPWLPAGSLGDEGTFDGEAARLFVSEYEKVEDLSQERIAWPIEGALARFGEETLPAGYRCGTLAADDWASVRDAASRANQLTPWTDAGDRFSILFRPLLPDESGC
jgi:hypothetical protein